MEVWIPNWKTIEVLMWWLFWWPSTNVRVVARRGVCQGHRPTNEGKPKGWGGVRWGGLSLPTISKKGILLEWSKVNMWMAKCLFNCTDVFSKFKYKEKTYNNFGYFTPMERPTLKFLGVKAKSSSVMRDGALCAPCHQTRTTNPFALLPIKRKEKKTAKNKGRKNLKVASPSLFQNLK